MIRVFQIQGIELLKSVKRHGLPFLMMMPKQIKIGYEQFYLPLIVMILTHLEDRIVLG